MVKMSDSSREFLEKHLPEALKTETRRDTLILLYELIDREGFEPPDYLDYNDFGYEAQRVYDDIYNANQGLKRV